ncbi:glycosyltransferase family 2 protein [Winogradskyella psychrotolerans]|uniref:glycosyltransferase family 2 protein n=1 Tax=Winogradskyella psychrotolerans TaxID=1344585 RepID=UPI001C06CB76|nr:glycosyltransferase family 2 protein [Winogradskyella psychrotolerans]MBU2919954.1 glycosyltransferase family 2 protein [Winogradskyella psychrotolerans]
MAFFSIIISVYNKEDYIKKTLESVINQSFIDFEIIVVNDGSTDNSVAAVESLNDKRIQLITTKNQGASHARNVGIKAASASYIALLDGDDSWESEYLQHMVDAIIKFPDLKIFSAGVSQKYQNKIVPVTYSFNQKELYGIHNYYESSRKFSIIHSSSVVFNKSIIEKTGYFDTSIVSGQDTDMWIRFGLYFDILFINKQLAHYNFYPSSLSNTTFDLSKKPKFDKYQIEEKENKALSIFLDLNRYSMAILSKLQNDKNHFLFYTSQLDKSNLSLKQNFLLRSPKWLLKLLLQIKSLKGEKVFYSSN